MTTAPNSDTMALNLPFDASHFYWFTFFAIALRCAKYALQGRALYTSHKSTTPTSHAPSRLLQHCGAREPFLLLLATMLATMLAASYEPSSRLRRLAAALAHTGFSMGAAHALEWGHGQYPVLWSSWALALLPPPYALAITRASAVYLFACAGLAKICVPAHPRDYFSTGTMRLLMSKDGAAPRFEAGHRGLARLFIRSPALLRCVIFHVFERRGIRTSTCPGSRGRIERRGGPLRRVRH